MTKELTLLDEEKIRIVVSARNLAAFVSKTMSTRLLTAIRMTRIKQLR